MTIDWSKPVQTRDGRPVEIITTSGRGAYPILGYIADDDSPSTWTADGQIIIGDGKRYDDLVNIPEERELWLNVYDDGCCFTHNNRAAADYASTARLKNIPRIACVHVKYKVGEGLNDD